MTGDVRLRESTDADVRVFFEQQLDPAANRMAAFTAKNPADWDAFAEKWAKIRADAGITLRTILFNGEIAGYIGSHSWFGKPELTYWVGTPFWGKGVASRALSEFLRLVGTRPLFAHTAADNAASIRVLEKCGFLRAGRTRGFSNARGEEIDEAILELPAADGVVLTLDRVADLRAEDHAAHAVLRQAVYPPELWAACPWRELEWASPEWCVRIRDAAGVLLSVVGLYLRDAECDGKGVKIGGVGNVKTHPAVRRRGLAAQGMQKAVEFFRGQPDVAFALLVCEPHLLGYYARLGWREFGGRLRIRQGGGACDYTLTRVMTYPIQSEAPPDGTIDLCGPPW